tara:strand:- start:316 stop:1368 length:1053 start_codon:yes stop_codon:yes gene_type:complete
MTETIRSRRRIPIENLYYLLSYSCDQVPETDEADLGDDDCPDSLHLLARILVRSTRRLVHRGLTREYIEQTEATPRLKGRILVAQSRREMVDRQAKMICRFDELNADCLPNQLLRSTCDRLLRIGVLEDSLRKDILIAREQLGNITPIRIEDSLFRRVRLHRNNRSYRLPLTVCRLIHRALTPSEREGGNRFHDIFEDEKAMPRIFESFVRNFADGHFPISKVSAMTIQWDGEWEADSAEVLPIMITDLTIEHPDSKLILDCKFYREALVSRHDRKRMHSSHLYQLTSYLRNKAADPGWENASGVLLYPAVDHDLDYRLTLNGHPVRVVSVDLDRPWREIEKRLIEVCAG